MKAVRPTLWFRREGPPSARLIELPKLGDESLHTRRIRCPLCEWQPAASSRWACLDHPGFPEFFRAGCGTAWNTFDTRGRCPGCSYQWRWTICLRCAGWSLHDDWYETTHN